MTRGAAGEGRHKVLAEAVALAMAARLGPCDAGRLRALETRAAGVLAGDAAGAAIAAFVARHGQVRHDTAARVAAADALRQAMLVQMLPVVGAGRADLHG